MPHLTITKLLTSSPSKTVVLVWLSMHIQTHNFKDLPETKRDMMKLNLKVFWQVSWKTELESISEPKSSFHCKNKHYVEAFLFAILSCVILKAILFLYNIIPLQETQCSNIWKLPLSSLNFSLTVPVCSLQFLLKGINEHYSYQVPTITLCSWSTLLTCIRHNWWYKKLTWTIVLNSMVLRLKESCRGAKSLCRIAMLGGKEQLLNNWFLLAVDNESFISFRKKKMEFSIKSLNSDKNLYFLIIMTCLKLETLILMTCSNFCLKYNRWTAVCSNNMQTAEDMKYRIFTDKFLRYDYKQ